MEKLLPIISIVVSVIVLVFSLLTFFSVNGIKSEIQKIQSGTEQAQQTTEGVPLSKQTLYNMEKQFIFTYPPKEGEKKSTNVVVNIGFVLNSEAEGVEDILTQFAEKQGLIRDRVQTLIKEKKENPFESVETQQIVKAELLELARNLFASQAIIDVVFSDVVTSQR